MGVDHLELQATFEIDQRMKIGGHCNPHGLVGRISGNRDRQELNPLIKYYANGVHKPSLRNRYVPNVRGYPTR